METLDLSYIEAGALVRGTIKQIFVEVEKHGGTVTYNEHKGFFETTFTHIHVEAE